MNATVRPAAAHFATRIHFDNTVTFFDRSRQIWRCRVPAGDVTAAQLERLPKADRRRVLDAACEEHDLRANLAALAWLGGFAANSSGGTCA